MKQIITFLFLILGTTFFAQDYNTRKGFVAEGYDVVAYFSNQAVKGNKKFTAVFNGVKLKFVSKENLESFKKHPKKYMPQYGGYCAYAIGVKSKKVTINPETFEIRNGKLYLFYNAWGTNTLNMWIEEGPEKLNKQAVTNWLNLTTNN